jgi:16S rRNA G966 N2-methylase RsmD
LTVTFRSMVEARPHTPVYTMHKYFARRPWNVFSQLVSDYSESQDIVLDPFCGGGVTLVESLRLERKVVGVDINPLATYVTEMECRPLDLRQFQLAHSGLAHRVQREISSLYSTRCTKCSSQAIADWVEWDEEKNKIIRLKFDCPRCHTKIKMADTYDDNQAAKIERDFASFVKRRNIWFPRTRIPPGDKTNSLPNQRINLFHELFTKRNLLALGMLLKEIDRMPDCEAKDFLRFAFSGSLKWASRQSHLRGEIVEGWAMHAYWIYPRSLEINVWNIFQRRIAAIIRGKKYSNQEIGDYSTLGSKFSDIESGRASCLVLNTSSDRLPIPNESIHAIITDPPYGGNVNYAELADYWHVWLKRGKTIEKSHEIIINKTRGKTLDDYENSLFTVFKECHRVLKTNHHLVSTFNSKDVRVVSSFVTAASRAGFTLPPNGVQYQKPIQAYTTTFHAMQIGAFVGDFIFTFTKQEKPRLEAAATTRDLAILKQELSELVSYTLGNEQTEPQLREKAYRMLIPFLAKHATSNVDLCKEAVNFFEGRISKHDHYFRDLRKRITERRRKSYLEKKEH